MQKTFVTLIVVAVLAFAGFVTYQGTMYQIEHPEMMSNMVVPY